MIWGSPSHMKSPCVGFFLMALRSQLTNHERADAQVKRFSRWVQTSYHVTAAPLERTAQLSSITKGNRTKWQVLLFYPT
jgi:hypothetical protein